jgi:hypothetical protein
MPNANGLPTEKMTIQKCVRALLSEDLLTPWIQLCNKVHTNAKLATFPENEFHAEGIE